MSIAVTADIIGSRRLDDRAAAQADLDAAISDVERALPIGGGVPLRPTVGDELQGVFPRLDTALAFILLLRLALPEGIDCRYGVGIGEVGSIPSRSRDIADGPGWWAAREAVETVHAMQDRALPSLRTWTVAAADEDADAARWANALCTSRDQLVSAMSPRARRLTMGRCLGRTQRALAEEEGVTQSAVSQVLASSGAAAVVEGYTLLVAIGGATAGPVTIAPSGR